MIGSVLDRLLDDGPEQGAMALGDLHAAVRRDLEALLNARRPWSSRPQRTKATRESILGFGLPDFAAGAFNAPAARDALCREIGTTISLFEPRLIDVTVALRDSNNSTDPVLRVRIRATLRTEGVDMPIGFETSLDSTTTDLTVREGANG